MQSQSRRVGRAAALLLSGAGVAAALWAACSPGEAPGQSAPGQSEAGDRRPERLAVAVVATRPHDPAAYTQGLLWHDGKLYESTGLYGRSTLRRVDPLTGEVEASVELSPHLFGEGLARVGERLLQLTWREGVALVWDLEGLREISRFTYEGEGWGLCHDGRSLVMSDGSSRLTLRDPASFAVLGRLDVTFRGRPVGRLNELECVEGWIYANVYATDSIVRIEPGSGRVTAVIDAAGLLAPEAAVAAEVLNGIAFDPERELFLLTGKRWPNLFEVRFVAAPDAVPGPAD